MLELILFISILLVAFSVKINGNYFTIIARTIQLLIAVYCLVSGHLGYFGHSVGISNSEILLYAISMALISYELEVMPVRRFLKEILYLSSSVFILSSTISLILLSLFVIQLVFLYTRKSYFIDYISLFIVTFISLIYFSELSTTVLTVKDSYYLYLTRGSEVLFFPLILIFGLIEYIRLLGIKRNISYLLAILPLVLLYKMKLSNNLNPDISLFLLPLFIPCIAKISSKLMSINTVKQNINVLFLISLITSFSYALVEKYELAITSVLILIILHLVYSISIYYREKDEQIFRVVTIFSLSNIACIPLGFFGFLFLDVLTSSSSVIGYVSLFVFALSSLIILCFTVRAKSEEIFLNILESSAKVKIAAFLALITTIVIIVLSLSGYVVGINSSQKLMVLIFNLEPKIGPNYILSYNLNFILFLVISVLTGYAVRTIRKNHFWHIGKKLEVFINNISSNNMYFERREKNKKKSKHIEKVILSDEGQVSSYTVSFIILSLFLVISLAIIEF